MRMITNSDGFTGATPIRMVSRPLSISSLRNRRAVALDEERFLGGRTLERHRARLA
jgi:hypothetical protein